LNVWTEASLEMTNKAAAIVTGSSRGIGRSIAIALSQEGYSVVVNYASSAEAAQAVVEEIRRTGGAAIAVAASVANAVERRRLIEQARDAFGDLSLLVNNAAITSQGRKDILVATEESWDVVFDTNLKGPFFLTQMAANWMRDSLGAGRLERATIINISSISAFAVSTNRADYCMTKAAMQMMTWLFAARLAEVNIPVYEICPGVISTDMTAGVRDKYDALIRDGLTPIRRWGQPEDIAKAVVALARGDLPFSTGDRIHVDGGFHIRRL
jgi:NAD(P)-dependent dehydrogenase (short-subunit alcohol dehydrogenase family)